MPVCTHLRGSGPGASQSRRLGASRSRAGASRGLSASSSRKGNGPQNTGAPRIYFKGRDATPQSLLIAKPSDTPGTGKGGAGAVNGAASPTTPGQGEAVMDRLSSGFSRSSLSARTRGSADDGEEGYDLASPLIEEGVDEEAELEATADDDDVLDLTPEQLDEPIALT